MTPCELEVLLHHYVSPERHPRATAPSVQQATAYWLNQGMLEHDDSDSSLPPEYSGLSVTTRGEVFIKEILATPLPVQHWVIER